MNKVLGSRNTLLGLHDQWSRLTGHSTPTAGTITSLGGIPTTNSLCIWNQSTSKEED